MTFGSLYKKDANQKWGMKSFLFFHKMENSDGHRKELDKVVGEHFNKPHHKYEDMLPTIIEQVLPLNDPFLRSRREKYWINKYIRTQFQTHTNIVKLVQRSCFQKCIQKELISKSE